MTRTVNLEAKYVAATDFDEPSVILATIFLHL